MHAKMLKPRTAIWILLGLTGMIGCGGGHAPAPAAKPSPTEPAAQLSNATTPSAPKDPARETSAPAQPPKIDDKSAAGAVQKTLLALKNGQLAEAYDFLPSSYQSDIDGLIHDFAGRMDAELWARLMTVARKSVDVLKTKKEFILALDLFRNRPEVEPYRKSWDASLGMLQTLLDSDLADLAKLKQIKARSLLPGDATPALPHLDTLGLALGANLTREFSGVTVTPVRTDGSEQIVAIQGPAEEKPSEIVYVQHDGHWLPKSLVENWKDGINADREWLDKLPGRIKTVKPRLLESLSQADEILDQLMAAENREEFERAAGPAILSLAATWPELLRTIRQAAAGDTDLPTITISINRELTEPELKKFAVLVLQPLRDHGSDYTLFANDGRTICRILKNRDSIALQASLATHFKIPASAIALDRDSSTIKVEIAP